MGCVLGQYAGNRLRPVAVAGRKFTKAELNYGTPKQELCAILNARPQIMDIREYKRGTRHGNKKMDGRNLGA